MTNFDEQAVELAARVRATGRGYLTLRREELRREFGIGRFTRGLAAEVCEALEDERIFVFPDPFDDVSTVRLYDRKHEIGGIADAVARPDEIPETSLHAAADLFARRKEGRDLRSDDAPWLDTFDLLLQVIHGRELEGWEDLRDDRHPSVLARDLAVALGIELTNLDGPESFELAAAVCTFRPRRSSFASRTPGSDVALDSLTDALAAADRRLREDHRWLLAQAARYWIGGREVPSDRVELGVLGLRYRREDAGRR